MLKLFEYFRLDGRVNDLFNRVRAELISSGKDEVWSHTLRVIKNLYLINEFYDFDFKIALVAAICHDIGYKEVINGHERASARMIKHLLDGLFDNHFVGEVIHCIETHECEGLLKPVTREALALHDADMLDYCGERGLINALLIGKGLGLSDSSASNRVINVINEGFLIPEMSKKFGRQLASTDDFFTELIKDLGKEKADFAKFGLTQ